MGLPHNSFDVVADVTLETFSHVADQPKLIEVIANLLRDRGYLILTTQNRSIYMRNSRIASAPPAEGQFRLWVTMQELRRLLSGRFECLRFGTVEPGGNRGLLRVVNSVKVTSFHASSAQKNDSGWSRHCSCWPENAANACREKKFAAP
jgi:hypothetical protein